MSRFFTSRYAGLEPYTPGEQPKDAVYIKLNTNESPYPPSPATQAAAARELGRLELYSDPQCRDALQVASAYFGVKPTQLLLTNGSDEILNFAFMAFCDERHPLVFPDISYGFYPVFARLNHIPYEEIPLRPDFTIGVEDYCGIGKNIVLANPNAPTGIALTRDEIQRIVASNPDNVVIVDEAYVDFGAESCVPLVQRYDNLLVTQTFSKSRSMAGARLGIGIGSQALMEDLNTIKYSTNPYNVNRMTLAAGAAALEDDAYYRDCCQKMMQTRETTARRLRELGFTVLPSAANFLFVSSPVLSGEDLYRQLRQKGILVRHFDRERIAAYNRISIGTEEQMDRLLEAVEEILKEAAT